MDRAYGPDGYLLGREKIVEFARATGETDPLYLDPEAARAAGHADVVAPPMFAVVFQSRPLGFALHDPELGIDFARLLHGAQEFRWGRLLIAGEEIATTVQVASIRERVGLTFFVFEARSTDSRGETVVTGIYTNIVRPREEG